MPGEPWVWLSEPVVDFGRRTPDGAAETRTVWLHADPSLILGVSQDADNDEVKRAYRRLARDHHPDSNPGDDDAPRRFQEIQSAFEAAVGEPEVAAHPPWGEWWNITGFSEPDPLARETSAVAGIVIEVDQAQDMPLGRAVDVVRITYAGQTLPLIVKQTVVSPVWRSLLAYLGLYPEDQAASPSRWSRAGTALEPVILALITLVAAPVLAILLGLLTYLLSNENVAATWLVMLITLCLGWGSLAATLVRGGLHAHWFQPKPRRTPTGFTPD